LPLEDRRDREACRLTRLCRADDDRRLSRLCRYQSSTRASENEATGLATVDSQRAKVLSMGPAGGAARRRAATDSAHDQHERTTDKQQENREDRVEPEGARYQRPSSRRPCLRRIADVARKACNDRTHLGDAHLRPDAAGDAR